MMQDMSSSAWNRRGSSVVFDPLPLGPLIEAGDDQGNVLARLTSDDEQQAAKLGALDNPKQQVDQAWDD